MSSPVDETWEAIGTAADPYTFTVLRRRSPSSETHDLNFGNEEDALLAAQAPAMAREFLNLLDGISRLTRYRCERIEALLRASGVIK